jgi:2-dehydropantoate 2-reductase
MRIAIFGAGGLGAYYGARLCEAGHEVGFIARGEHLRAICDKGLAIKSPRGDVHLKSVLASDDPAAIGVVDLVIVAVKTWQIPQVASAMAPLMGPDTMVVPFLNGVDAPDGLAEVLGEQHVLGGLSKVFSLIEAPGVIHHFSPGAYVEIGELHGGTSERVRHLSTIFEEAGVDVGISEDIRSALWFKLLMVSSWAGLGALARSPMGELRSESATHALIDQSMDEGIAVGRASGHTLADDCKQQLWDFYMAMPVDATASMQRDLMQGRPSELDAWNGAIVRIGEQYQVPTPMHRLVWTLLQPMERRARMLINS